MNKLFFVPVQTRIFNDFYRLRCDENNVKWSGHITPPISDNLYKFVERCMTSETRFVFLAYNEQNQCVGYCYCDIDDDNKTIESSFGVDYSQTRKGYGTQIIEFAHRYGKIVGMNEHIVWVSEQNIASNKVFLKLGFTNSGEYELRNLPLLGGSHKFYKLTKMI